MTGSVSKELDELLAEGLQPEGSFETPEIAAVRNRCRVAQISLYEGPLAEFGVKSYYCYNKHECLKGCQVKQKAAFLKEVKTLYPLDTGSKLNVLCMFNLRRVSRG